MSNIGRSDSKNDARISKDRKTGTKYAQLCDRIKMYNLAPSDVSALLKREGFTAGSASSTASYLMNLSNPENAKTLEDVRSGKETMRNARKRLAKKQTNPARSNEEKLYRLIDKAARLAIQLDCDRQMFVDECVAAFNAETLE